MTVVVFEGVMGRLFGREWHVDAATPSEALRIIEANRPGLRHWLAANVGRYTHFRVRVNSALDLSESEYGMERHMERLHFRPLLQGAKKAGTAQVIIGTILIVAGMFVPGLPGAIMIKMGTSLVLSGIAQMLTPMPKKSENDAKESASRYMGGADVSYQGDPVPIGYGEYLVDPVPVEGAVWVEQISASGAAATTAPTVTPPTSTISDTDTGASQNSVIL